MPIFLEYFEAIVIIAAVLAAAYYVTRLVGKAGGSGFRKTTGIRMIGSQSMGKDKSVALVEIGRYRYVLGVSAQRVELIDKLGPEETTQLGEETMPMSDEQAVPPTFAESFRQELNKRLGRPDK